jgi:hypothetical protein
MPANHTILLNRLDLGAPALTDDEIIAASACAAAPAR